MANHSAGLPALLAYAVRADASDLHIRAGAPPVARVNGALAPVPGAPELDPATVAAIAGDLLSGAPARAAELEREGETDVAWEQAGLGRLRASIFRRRGTLAMVLRVIPDRIRGLDELGLPPAVSRLAAAERGIVLVTGTTGSGKSTTLAAMIDAINRNARRHILTIEDPIELLHPDRASLVSQREVGPDTRSFGAALRRAMRQDPDVIMIGEIRDTETMEAALQAAETGHLVLSTLHTLDATETVNRAIGLFPPHQQDPVRTQLAGTLRGVVSQRLVPTADGGGRVPACEVLVVTGRARDMISDPARTADLSQVIREGEYYGMQTFDQSLFEHLAAGRITMDAAMAAAASPQDLRLMVEAGASRRGVALSA